jgi:DNA-binding NarL/FixJ family response regulator
MPPLPRRGSKGGAPMTGASRNGLRESPAVPGAFVSQMTLGETRSQGLPVAVCAKESFLRDRVTAALEAAGHLVVAQSASGEELLASCDGNAPACIVIASDRPDRPTVGIVRLVRSVIGDLSAVLVCRSAVVGDVRRALELGVDGIVLEEGIAEALGAVVEAVCAGQVSAPSGQRRALRARALTTREKQVLMLVATGLTNSQIAEELFLAESTVKSHLSSAFGKLGVSSRSEAAAVVLDPDRGGGLGIARVSAASGAVR